ncbi:MAG: DUF3391 domain-containing protein [Shewanella sp.]|nr:DUF3391 domain-containing protein [Shewanella sp.]
MIKQSDALLKIPVNQLTIGMFVTQIENRNQTIAISNPGQIRSRDDIIKLKLDAAVFLN